jgi:large subunit ribosomal protein L35
MPKLKSHKGILKRIKVTRKGKVVGHPGGNRHLQSNKTPKHKQRLGRAQVFSEVPARRLKDMIKSH